MAGVLHYSDLPARGVFMTYCLAIRLEAGLVFCSDSRTNAGIDNVSTYSKMHRFTVGGRRHFTLLSAGNLATTQGVVKRLREDIEQGAGPSLQQVATAQEAVEYVGAISVRIQRQQAEHGPDTAGFEASFIFGGQIAGQKPAIFLIYPQGNAIHESQEHPFLQIGEVKYGKPILDRIVNPKLGLEQAARCALVSMNSTLRSNATVGPPIDLLLYQHNIFDDGRFLHLGDDDPFLQSVSQRWSEGLSLALENLPAFSWERTGEDPSHSRHIYPFLPHS
ncbi:MAG: peptidase [Acidiferrobacter sp.]